jgi:CheY-like chemotaxis protein
LSLLGCVVTASAAGSKGLLALEQKEFDALLIGTTLADMGGEKFIDVLAQGRSLDGLKLMSLVYMNSKSNNLLSNANKHVDVHLTKPVKLESLHNSLADLISGVTSKLAVEQAELGAAEPESLGTVLVVEDNEVNQMVALGMLENMGFEVSTAENGRVALECLRENSFDLILMDCQMPEMDGYEATRCIRKLSNAKTASTPIIALTANAMSGDAEKCIEAGMDDYLAKPFEPEVFEEKLKSWINNTRDRVQAAPAAPRKAA